MAGIKLAYIGGGSTRAPGTVASFIARAEGFAGSEIVLVDLDPERLEIVRAIAERMISAHGLDLRIGASTDRASALQECDAVLTSYRPGGFEARYLDESIPLKHGVIGQETQGPGGFFMALRSIHAMRGIVRDMEAACPDALLVNYTNPINIVSQAITEHSELNVVSLCEGPIIFPRMVARAAGLNPDKVSAVMIGLNHGCWSIKHEYEDGDLIALVRDAWMERRDDPRASSHARRLLHLTSVMQALPADYFQYYYFTDEILAELTEKATTRSEDIMAAVPDYWAHYAELARSPNPQLDPHRSRGGINELELAVDVLDAYFNDRGTVWPVNVVNNGTIPDLPDRAVVEVPAAVRRSGIQPISYGPLPRRAAGLVKMLCEYQMLTADAAWRGSLQEAVRALMAHPWMLDLDRTEKIYAEMSRAQADFLPDRLVA